MMKRALAILLAALFTATVSATEATTYCRIDSSYMILIPEVIEVGAGTVYLQSQYVDLRPEDNVIVTIDGLGDDGYAHLATATGDEMIAAAYNTESANQLQNGDVVGRFVPGNGQSVIGFSLAKVSWRGAGDYLGTLIFNISLEEVG